MARGVESERHFIGADRRATPLVPNDQPALLDVREPLTSRINLKLPARLAKAVNRIAVREANGLSATCRRLLTRGLELERGERRPRGQDPSDRSRGAGIGGDT